MVDLQRSLHGLMRKDEEYKLQVITWHKMFSREVRLREAMKRVIQVLWGANSASGAGLRTAYTANDIIIGLESGASWFKGTVQMHVQVSFLDSALNAWSVRCGRAV